MEQLNSKERELAIRHLKYIQYRDNRNLSESIAIADIGTKDLTFGRLAMSIPEDHYEMLKLIYPDLICPDGKIKTNFIVNKAPKIDLFKAYMINPNEQLKGKRCTT